MNSHQLPTLVARAQVNFELLVQRLKWPGYVTSLDRTDGLGLTRASIGAVKQESFDQLLHLLLPEERGVFVLRTHATCKGAVRGLYTSVLFNEAVIEFDQMQEVLLTLNRRELP